MAMEKDIRESIALKRFEIISPGACRTRKSSERVLPPAGRTRAPLPPLRPEKSQVSTMKTWLKKYRKKGFDALKPKSRADGGRPKRLDEQTSK
jgi:putative transposase